MLAWILILLSQKKLTIEAMLVIRPVSVLNCFLINITTDDVQQPSKYVKDQNVLHSKLFGFRIGHSADHTIALMSLHL